MQSGIGIYLFCFFFQKQIEVAFSIFVTLWFFYVK